MQFKHMQLYQESFKILFYSIKLKLEMNILSKLVDLVHGSATKNRAMTLEAIDSNAVQGQAQRDVQQELAGGDSVVNWFGSDSKTGMDHIQNDIAPDSRFPSISRSASSPLDDDTTILRVLSHPSSTTPRTTGREVDSMYADFCRTLSR
jgi:hypothetical protein